MARYKLSKAEINRLNADLKDIADIKEDIARAAQAGVENMTPLAEACDHCESRIKALKQHYAENER